MSADAEWLYWDDAGGAASGPISLAEAAALVRSGRIGSATAMRRSSEIGWKPAATALPELFLTEAETQSPASTGWTDTRPHPWRRYAARMFDSFIVGTVVWSLLGLLFYSMAPAQAAAFFRLFDFPGGQFFDIILTLLVVIPFNALAIGLTGLSLGKWVFGISVTKDGRPMGVRKALQREGAVFVFGLGCGIPFASLFTLLGSFNQLKDDRITSWDKAAKLTVNYRPQSTLALIGMWGAVVLLLLLRTGAALLARMS